MPLDARDFHLVLSTFDRVPCLFDQPQKDFFKDVSRQELHVLRSLQRLLVLGMVDLVVQLPITWLADHRHPESRLVLSTEGVPYGLPQHPAEIIDFIVSHVDTSL